MNEGVFVIWQTHSFRWLMLGGLLVMSGAFCFVRALWLAKFGL